jgi:hypothetical protein
MDQVRQAAGARPAEDIEAGLWNDRARALVAEPDDAVRARVVGVLRAVGYEVVEVRSADGLARYLPTSLRWSRGMRPPDLLVLEADIAREGAARMLSTLARAEWTVPMIVLGQPLDLDAVRAQARRFAPPA